MRRAALLVCVTGILVLFLFLFQSPEDFSEDKAYGLKESVSLSGVVSAERRTGALLVMTVNNMTLVCRCEGSFLKKNVSVVGFMDEYKQQRQIRVLRIYAS